MSTPKPTPPPKPQAAAAAADPVIDLDAGGDGEIADIVTDAPAAGGRKTIPYGTAYADCKASYETFAKERQIDVTFEVLLKRTWRIMTGISPVRLTEGVQGFFRPAVMAILLENGPASADYRRAMAAGEGKSIYTNLEVAKLATTSQTVLNWLMRREGGTRRVAYNSDFLGLKLKGSSEQQSATNMTIVMGLAAYDHVIGVTEDDIKGKALPHKRMIAALAAGLGVASVDFPMISATNYPLEGLADNVWWVYAAAISRIVIDRNKRFVKVDGELMDVVALSRFLRAASMAYDDTTYDRIVRQMTSEKDDEAEDVTAADLAERITNVIKKKGSKGR